jgi:pSer/pThr/pTyr-binding forkhead associated (FHA) protein
VLVPPASNVIGAALPRSITGDPTPSVLVPPANNVIGAALPRSITGDPTPSVLVPPANAAVTKPPTPSSELASSDKAVTSSAAPLLTPQAGHEVSTPTDTLSCDWIALTPAGSQRDPLVIITARPVITLGKLRANEVELCMRNYPVTEHMLQCHRLSRRHVRLAYDEQRGMVMIDDLGSANGTRLDGQKLEPGRQLGLTLGHEYQLALADVVHLRLRVIANRSGKSGSKPEAVIINRADNRPGMIYVMLLGKVRVGGPGADVVTDTSSTAIELTRPRRHWWWRRDQQWLPLIARSILSCHKAGMQAQAGDLSFFD